ncbi:hypothetical protein IFM89_032115 [Coptis chinensis]|uniref:Uncharacterized protein n=1 Tax=Coptis chinensis TaxID=261450 RepID=A0A835IP47_9MAGN|nr:hypothetical protein IFM89_032115 [Coptis chinensis]
MDSKHLNNKASTMQILDRLDKGLIPDEELRKLVLIQFKRRLQLGYKPTYAQQLEFNLNIIKSLKQMKMSGTMDVINSESYDLPAAFLEAMFGQTLKQSFCYFEDESTTLDEAEAATHDLYCERAQIQDGQRILDIGCGQGSFVIHVAQKFKGCHVTGITNSTAQKSIIEERCKSVLMKNVGLFLRKLSKWMTEDGLLFLDYICHKTFGHHFEVRSLTYFSSSLIIMYIRECVCEFMHVAVDFRLSTRKIGIQITFFRRGL